VNEDNYQEFPPDGRGQAAGYTSYPSFPEIFKHAWPVLWEKPKVIILLALFLALVQVSLDQISNILFSPYLQDFQNFADTSATDKEKAQAALFAAIRAKGALRLFFACAFPFFAAPFVGFCLSRGALSIWDGIRLEFRDILQCLASYPRCLLFFLFLCLYALVLSLLTMAMCLPGLVLSKLLGKAGFLLVAALVMATGYFWVRFLWPVVRRFLFIQFFAFFHISDHPGGSDLIKNVWDLDQLLKFWPSHLNYMALYTFLTIFVIFIPVGIIQFALMAVRPEILSLLVGQFILFFGVLWPAIAIAGFYRICLGPPEDIPPVPQYQTGVES
jgi:hypothetical protein